MSRDLANRDREGRCWVTGRHLNPERESRWRTLDVRNSIRRQHGGAEIRARKTRGEICAKEGRAWGVAGSRWTRSPFSRDPAVSELFNGVGASAPWMFTACMAFAQRLRC